MVVEHGNKARFDVRGLGCLGWVGGLLDGEVGGFGLVGLVGLGG